MTAVAITAGALVLVAAVYLWRSRSEPPTEFDRETLKKLRHRKDGGR